MSRKVSMSAVKLARKRKGGLKKERNSKRVLAKDYQKSKEKKASTVVPKSREKRPRGN